jgi:hypothetical protein
MPLFNDLKKMFFGAKSVAKHQAGKAADRADEAGEELARQGDELLDLTKQAARELANRAPGYIEKGKDALEDLGDAVFREDPPAKERKQTEKAEDVIDDELNFGKLDLSAQREAPKSGSIDFEEDLRESAPPTPREPSAFQQVADSTLDGAARAGLKAKEAAGKAGEELLNRAATVGAGLKGKADAFIDHANREAEKMRLEDSIEEARRAAEQAEARARAFDNGEGQRDTSESVLDGTDSFFERADRFAKGDYHNEGGKQVRIQDDPDYRKEKKSDLIAGFLDSDGDGDSLIDDAVIEEE